jgi:hypothetical protein
LLPDSNLLMNPSQKQPDRRPQVKDFCTNNPHRYWVVDLVGVEEKGIAVLVAFCTDCGDVLSKEIKISQPGDKLRLLLEEKQKLSK